MKNYNLTIEDGMITWIEDYDQNGAPIPGILYIPKEATEFSDDAWIHLGCTADGICVHKDNPVYSSAHNCLLSKDGTKLIKTCKTSDVSKLTGLKTIGRDAFQTPFEERDAFIFRMRQEPQGSSDFRLRSQGPCRLGTGESGLVLG